MKLDDGFRELDQATFERVRDTWLRPAYGLDGLRLLREKAVRECDLREIHRTEHRWGRAPYELLQNANDVVAKHAVFEVCNDGLGFAHDGRWFTVDNFRSLAEGWSDKKPDECIGHKGLGFRSVLDITPAPHFFRVARNTFFGVKFTWAVNKGYIDETIRRNPKLARFRDDLLGQGQPYCPIMAIPATAKKASVGSGITMLGSCAAGCPVRVRPERVRHATVHEHIADLDEHRLILQVAHQPFGLSTAACQPPESRMPTLALWARAAGRAPHNRRSERWKSISSRKPI